MPAAPISNLADRLTPSNIVFHVDSVAVGLRGMLRVKGLKVYDTTCADPMRPIASASLIEVEYLKRHVFASELRFPRLHDGYYHPGNKERNARVEVELPEVPRWTFELERPFILGVAPEKVIGEVSVRNNRLSAERLRVYWPDRDVHMHVDGFTYVDFNEQEVYGEAQGEARQANIRGLMQVIDCPPAMPYYDGFTEVTKPVPSWCSWRVNLVNNDCDLGMRYSPTMGRYNGVPMKSASGDLHLHIYTRGTNLNYRQTFGPIVGEGLKGEQLDGTVWVSGTNGYNTVRVAAQSSIPVAQLLKIGGFTGDYAGEDVFGNSKCDLEFRFPRAMTNNYELLNGRGHLEVRDGRLMRLKGMRGLVELLAEKVPGVSWFTDSTQASCDYVIENGVLKSDNIYIEGSVFSIKMYGSLDTVRQQLDFTVRVQFAKNESMIGKILHPLAWPFTKLLLEFRLKGSPAAPRWEYVSVVDRVMEAVQ